MEDTKFVSDAKSQPFLNAVIKIKRVFDEQKTEHWDSIAKDFSLCKYFL